MSIYRISQIVSAVILSIAAGLSIACSDIRFEVKYGSGIDAFFTFTQLAGTVASVVAIIFAQKHLQSQTAKNIWSVMLALVGLALNPIFSLDLEREEWAVVFGLGAIVIGLSNGFAEIILNRLAKLD